MLEPVFRSVTVFVCQTSLPVPASRQTSSPEVFAENTYSARKRAVEVLLKTRFETAFVSGHSTEAAGLSASSFNMRPPINNRSPEKTGVDTAASPDVRSISRHQVLPVAGSSEVTASWVQTMSCFRPPAVTMIGEL